MIIHFKEYHKYFEHVTCYVKSLSYLNISVVSPGSVTMPYTVTGLLPKVTLDQTFPSVQLYLKWQY